MSELSAITLRPPIDVTSAGPPGAASTPAASGPAFGQVLRALGKEIQRGEAVVDRAAHASGRDLSSGDLLALQAGVYRYVEVVDLTSKLVDRATQAVKQVVQSQG